MKIIPTILASVLFSPITVFANNISNYQDVKSCICPGRYSEVDNGCQDIAQAVGIAAYHQKMVNANFSFIPHQGELPFGDLILKKEKRSVRLCITGYNVLLGGCGI